MIYDSGWSDIVNKQDIVAEFLNKCIDYAEQSIIRKQQRDEHELIPAWRTYIQFTQHALDEVKSGKLDPWFDRDEKANLSSGKCFDIMDFDHKTRSAWLAGIISPRPLVLASTIDKNGIKNLAPLTSVMGVSNTPPLFIASFSKNKQKQYRGTLLNMRETKKAILHVMPSTVEAVEWIDLAGSPIPPSESEWDLINVLPHNDEDLLIQHATAAVEVELVEEKELPGAQARLAVMRANHIWVTSDKIPEQGLAILTQHGMDNIMPAPSSWSKKVDKHYGVKD